MPHLFTKLSSIFPANFPQNFHFIKLTFATFHAKFLEPLNDSVSLKEGTCSLPCVVTLLIKRNQLTQCQTFVCSPLSLSSPHPGLWLTNLLTNSRQQDQRNCQPSIRPLKRMHRKVTQKRSHLQAVAGRGEGGEAGVSRQLSVVWRNYQQTC